MCVCVCVCVCVCLLRGWDGVGLGWGVVLCLEEKGLERGTQAREREGHRERGRVTRVSSWGTGRGRTYYTCTPMQEASSGNRRDQRRGTKGGGGGVGGGPPTRARGRGPVGTRSALRSPLSALLAGDRTNPQGPTPSNARGPSPSPPRPLAPSPPQKKKSNIIQTNKIKPSQNQTNTHTTRTWLPGDEEERVDGAPAEVVPSETERVGGILQEEGGRTGLLGQSSSSSSSRVGGRGEGSSPDEDDEEEGGTEDDDRSEGRGGTSGRRKQRHRWCRPHCGWVFAGCGSHSLFGAVWTPSW